MKAWGLAERERALAGAERDGLDLLVIGGGISGAGILRDAASRRFIVFCDDLSFEAADQSYKSLKAVLDGGIEGRPAGGLGLVHEISRACSFIADDGDLAQPRLRTGEPRVRVEGAPEPALRFLDAAQRPALP